MLFPLIRMSCQDSSNVGSQHMFSMRNKKIFPVTPSNTDASRITILLMPENELVEILQRFLKYQINILRKLVL